MRRAFPLIFTLALLPGCSPSGPAGKDPQDLILRGWDEFRLNETLRSEVYFAKAASLTPPDSGLHLMALYGWGSSLAFRSPTPLEAEGAAKWEEVVRLAPQSDLAAWSLLALARLNHAVPVGREPDYDKARAAYDRLLEAFPDHPASEEAFVYKESTWVAPLKAEGARKALPEILGFIQRKPQSKWISAAWGLVAECYGVLNEPERRLEAEINVLNKAELDPTNPRSDYSGNYWKIASLAEFRAGNFAAARKYYKKLLDEYPTDQKCFAAEKALDRMSRVESQLRRGEKP